MSARGFAQFDFGQPRLSTKLAWVAVAFLVVALLAIGFTLLESWKFEGGAGAINDMGSERMRTYRIAYLLSDGLRDPARAQATQQDLVKELETFEAVMLGLRRGDPARPLFLPRNPEIASEVDAVLDYWRREFVPAIKSVLAASDSRAQQARTSDLRPRVERFVQRIDRLVGAIERENSRDIAFLRYTQFSLVILAVAGTVALIYLMFLLVVRPVGSLHDGLRRMAQGELATRLPIETRDEFGELALGFNRMAERLQELYATLEQRVAEKTRSLADRNRELATLYEVTALLNEPNPVDVLCRGFLRKLITLLDAQAGAVRLTDPATGEIHLFVHEGLPSDFAEAERCIRMSECLCGETAQAGTSVVRFMTPVPVGQKYRCGEAEFQTVSVFPIRFGRQLLGVFNLFYRDQRDFSRAEQQILETLGQHLAVAIENQRLVSREKEMAVSEERNLLAQELHDSIAQSLAFLNLQAQLLEDSLRRSAMDEARDVLSRIREGIQESYDDVRELLVHFRMRIKHEDIELTIRASLEQFELQTGIKTALAVSGSGIPLSPEQHLQVLHILQEALSNVRKHSGARHVDVEMRRDGGYWFRVRDDGQGFDPGAPDDRSGAHVGLRIMKERAARIGGQVSVESRPGHGAEITLTLPVAQRAVA